MTYEPEHPATLSGMRSNLPCNPLVNRETFSLFVDQVARRSFGTAVAIYVGLWDQPIDVLYIFHVDTIIVINIICETAASSIVVDVDPLKISPNMTLFRIY